MTYYLKQSTATTVKFGPFLDETTGKDAEVGLAITQADIRLSKNGGNMAQTNNVAGATHDELGFYDVPLDATDTDTLGSLLVAVHESGALPVFQYFMVVPANVWDSLFGADSLQVDAVQISGDATAADNAESFFDGTGYAGTNNVIPLVTTTTTNTDMRGTDNAALAATALTDATWTDARAAYLDELAAANIPTDLTNLAAAVDLNTLIISPVGGTTDGDGNVGGTTVLDSTRSEDTNHWNNLAIEITSGACIGQLRPIELFTSGVGFTVPTSRPFTAQIVTGVTYRIVSAVIAQPGITVTKNAQAVIEPDGSVNLGLSIVTSNGAPPTGDITPGTISIYRVRAGTPSLIVNGAAMSEAEGNVYYTYTFPSASWAAGDSYLAVTTGQSVIVNGTDYPLSITAMQGYVTREAVIAIDVAGLDGDAMRGTDGANTTVPDAAGTAAALHVTTDAAIAALNDISVTDITQRQIPDSVPADGVLPTIEQALYMITQFMMERAVSGTTVTVKKVDGSTSLLTLTLDDASDPTSITRAT